MRKIKGVLYGKESVSTEEFRGRVTRSPSSSCEQWLTPGDALHAHGNGLV